MTNLRIVFALVLVVAWWQKDTLEDRALTQEGFTASSAQLASRAWSAVTPPSPAKSFISARDQWLDDLFNPQQDYSHPTVDSTPNIQDKTPEPVPSAPKEKESKDKTPAKVEAPVLKDAHDRKLAAAAASSEDHPAKTKASPEETPPLESFSAANIKRILIVGDSMSGDVGLSLRQLAFKYKQKAGVDVQIIDAHRHSTGLVVPSYYDWPRELPPLLSKNAPQVVVFMVGANDGQSMRLENQSWVIPGSPGWSTEYQRRAKQVVDTIPASAKLVWLDLPPVRLKSLQEKTLQVNGSVKDALAACKNCVMLETRSAFGGDTYVENTSGKMLRSKDGIHYSRSGASFVASKLWTELGLPVYD